MKPENSRDPSSPGTVPQVVKHICGMNAHSHLPTSLLSFCFCFFYLQLQITKTGTLPILGSRQAAGPPKPPHPEWLPQMVQAMLPWLCQLVESSVLPGMESIRLTGGPIKCPKGH